MPSPGRFRGAGRSLEVLRAEAEGQRAAGGSKDAREGGLSFLEKRKPAFTGA